MSRVEDWVRLKNSNAGPALLERAKGSAGEGSGLYEECTPQLQSSSLPNLPNDVFGLIIAGVLTKEECEGLIRVIPTSGQGYMSPEDVRTMYRDRVVHRYLTHDPALSSLILNRIRPYLPDTLDEGKFVEISPSWRFLRYEVGGHQAAHLDGRENSLSPHPLYRTVQSRLTIQMYLNDHAESCPQERGEEEQQQHGYRGGEMVFYEQDGETVRLVHYPRAGDCLVFLQESMRGDDFELIHEAKAIEEGTKYAMRTVVDYGWL
jgi:hypothetical protein